MKNFKLISVLSLGLLLSTNSLVLASVNNNCDCSCLECCGYVQDCSCHADCCGGDCCYPVSYKEKYLHLPSSFFSPDGNFSVYMGDYNSRVVGSVCNINGMLSKRDIFEFKNLVSFSFSKDSKYLLVERSEYNSKIGMQNDFIEIFDLVNKKRIFFMPFYKKCYPASSYYSTKSYDIDDLVFLNFYGDTLESVEFDFEGNYIFVPANLYNVRSVYASQLGLGLSVKFNDGSMKVYIPTKDFSGFSEMLAFGKSVSANDHKFCLE